MAAGFGDGADTFGVMREGIVAGVWLRSSVSNALCVTLSPAGHVTGCVVFEDVCARLP